MRVPSAAAARIAPPCVSTRRGSPSRSASTIASSPRTKATVGPRKCAAMTAPSAATSWVRSMTDGVSLLPVSVMSLINSVYSTSPAGEVELRDTALEPFGDLLAGQIAADEDDAALALLVLLPRPLMIAVEDHVHALKHEAPVVVLEGEDALAA